MDRVINTLIVDEFAMVRQGLRALLATVPDLCVVGEARDGRTAVQQTRTLQPDVIVIDPKLPDLEGVTVIQAMHSECPQSQILVLTNVGEDAQVRAAFGAGVRGYLLKDTVLTDVIIAIRDVYDGKLAVHPSITHVVIQAMQDNLLREK